MSFHPLIYFLLGSLATYRLALLFSKESGPAFIFRKIRKLPPPKSSAREGLACLWCESIWMSAVVTTYFLLWFDILVARDWPLWWLAMSAAAILINQQWTKG